MANARQQPKPQVEKFREAARELEADDSEEAFDAKLKKIAKSKSDQNTPSKKKEN